jgi:hypothetical protein
MDTAGVLNIAHPFSIRPPTGRNFTMPFGATPAHGIQRAADPLPADPISKAIATLTA